MRLMRGVNFDMMRTRGFREKMIHASAFLAASLLLTVNRTAPVSAQGGQAATANAASATSKELAGAWQGVMHAGRDVRMVVRITGDGKGGYTAVFTNADHGESIPPAALKLEGDMVTVSSAALGTFYEGKLSADGKTIDGQWKLAPNPLPLVLNRATPETAWTVAPPPARIPPMAADANPSFEVATIKPNNSGVQRMQGLIVHGRNFMTRNSSLEDLISFAYGVQTKQIVNAPPWIDSERYDIDAVPDAPGTPNVEQLRIMVRKLLTDRFKLAFHHEKRELSAYVLTVAKNGEKLTMNESKGQLPGLGFGPGKGGLTMHVMNAGMTDFASFLQEVVLDRPVVDRTELAGKYDFSCTFAPDDSEFGGHPPQMPGAAPAAQGAASTEPAEESKTATLSAANLFEAMQQQLGLKLSAEKTDVEVIAIDHLDHPSQN